VPMAISAPAICSRTLRRPQQAEFRHHRSAIKCSGDEGNELALLADFSASYSFTRTPIAIGFSNGAITAAALLLTRPGLLAGAILFRPLSPFRGDPPAHLDGAPVLIIDGEKDSRRSPGDGALLADRLTYAGAMVSHHVLPVGHSITAMDREIAREWLRR
jgi:predicted esterase